MLIPLVSVILLFYCCHGQKWDGYLQLDTEGKYHVWWTVTGEEINFQVEVKTKGWIGFGISPDGRMGGSDIVIGWVNSSRAGFQDRYAVGNTVPVVDDRMDWELIWCCENDTHTTLRFKRAFDTCDQKQDLPISPTEKTRLIWAYNDRDPTTPTAVNYHGSNRGTSPAIISRASAKSYALNELTDALYWDVTSANVLIPHDKDTSYYCTMFAAPVLSRKHHVVRVEPLIQKGNEPYVHHIVLYKCSEVPEFIIGPFHLRQYSECYSDDLTTNFPFCQHIWTGWALGRSAFELPDHVGMPIEKVYYRLEVHYDNPELKEGIYDNSGLRLAYTPTLRQYDSECLTVGSLWYPCVFVPPKQTNFVTSGHAHPTCLRKGLPEEGLKVFAVSLHSHVIGKSIIVRHFRNEEELPPIAKDKNYNFKYQSTRLLPEERIVLPDDHLVVECTYDSTDRNQTTFGGLGTKQEMCLAFLSYYPKLAIHSSVSCPSPKKVLNSIGVKNSFRNGQYVLSPVTGRNETYIEYINNYRWDNSSLNAVQEQLRYGSHISVCSIGENTTVTSEESTYPRLKRSYQELDLCASRSTTSSPRIQDPLTTRPPQVTTLPRPQVTQTPATEQQNRKKKVPQTIPYEIIDRIIAEQFG